MAQVRDRWRALVNTAMNFQVTLTAGNFWIISKLSATEGRLCSTQLVS